MHIDFHSHTLPWADHGCEGRSVSKKQLEAAQNAGIDVLCVTPHFYPHRHNIASFLEKKEEGKQALASWQAPPRLVFGAEVLLCEGLEKMEGLENLCFEGTRTLLLEMPERPLNEELCNTIAALQEKFTPILAHVERYPAEERDRALSICPRAQMNYDGVASFFKKHYALKLAKSGLLYALGSDLHGEAPVYSLLPSVKKALGDEGYQTVMARASSLLGLS